MALRVRILAAVAAVCMSAAASAETKLEFPKQAFQIYGGMQTPGEAVEQHRPRAPSRQIVDFQTELAPGSVLVRTAERRLYFVLPEGKAILYRVGVGREGFQWSGTNRVTRKNEWPEWRPPTEMIDREAKKGHVLPASMPGGRENPLGARAIYIGDTQYRIHGTTQPWSIGLAVSSGCIRMMNEQVIDLFDRVKVGATVVVE